MAPGLRGLQDRWACWSPVVSSNAGAVQLLGYSSWGWLGRPLLARARLLPVSPAGVELPRPPLRDARRGPRERARHLQLLPGEPNFCAGFGLADPERRTALSWGGVPTVSASTR
ncbi:hypothetical protein ACRRTK_010281 [Alexandromys fortis]